MTKAFRHGDLCLLPIKNLPDGLEKAKTQVIMTGSGGNDHIAKNCDIYFKREDDFVFGYLEAKKGNKWYHKEHGKKVKGEKLMECSLPVGVYQLRNQIEDTNEGMKQVVD